MTATPTDAERQKAHEVWNEALCNSGIPGWNHADAFAQALADQRARYEAIADELESDDHDPGFYAAPDYWAGISAAAERIRQVSQ